VQIDSDVVLEDRPNGLEGPGLVLGLGLGLRNLAVTTAFFDRYFFVYFLILETFAVGQITNLIHGAPKFFSILV